MFPGSFYLTVQPLFCGDLRDCFPLPLASSSLTLLTILFLPLSPAPSLCPHPISLLSLCLILFPSRVIPHLFLSTLSNLPPPPPPLPRFPAPPFSDHPPFYLLLVLLPPFLFPLPSFPPPSPSAFSLLSTFLPSW